MNKRIKKKESTKKKEVKITQELRNKKQNCAYLDDRKEN
jgi:hypothetical protein